jgi:hypothetical protein
MFFNSVREGDATPKPSGTQVPSEHQNGKYSPFLSAPDAVFIPVKHKEMHKKSKKMLDKRFIIC